ncbi:hypothetical protein H072_11465 [Dactylellina haptotyla CBS 200.50]|uniref:Uncharacterized protein n=1 Tax=Dactylellina haptotyla (strain CBS 200.50) TaxID=1284197 RepID=S8B884_DACHA|nr:hypothetical protein H072_11465 [Dactylellina haptotyla CBS 200.50]
MDALTAWSEAIRGLGKRGDLDYGKIPGFFDTPEGKTVKKEDREAFFKISPTELPANLEQINITAGYFEFVPARDIKSRFVLRNAVTLKRLKVNAEVDLNSDHRQEDKRRNDFESLPVYQVVEELEFVNPWGASWYILVDFSTMFPKLKAFTYKFPGHSTPRKYTKKVCEDITRIKSSGKVKLVYWKEKTFGNEMNPATESGHEKFLEAVEEWVQDRLDRLKYVEFCSLEALTNPTGRFHSKATSMGCKIKPGRDGVNAALRPVIVTNELLR